MTALLWASLTVMAPTMPPRTSTGQAMRQVAGMGASVVMWTAVVAGLALLAGDRGPERVGRGFGAALVVFAWLVGLLPTVGFSLLAWLPH